ncbi:hypothetical protein UA08_07301 [Talaromyces atroroseus]|uniref:D-lactate dehydratase n=1 Tax=Talaromyces atroroseus TaxID=1441469 RepID=A0A225AKU0_TALAT|nr:hypothetical protein UA08_07301 [Talaromyces atroroseus]OKL57848.1 hypothetical protein UA08_07301 [Talaromyces atroroseus]
MAPKVLIVLTSQATIPKTNHPTGWYLVGLPTLPSKNGFQTDLLKQPEFAHPWKELHDAGIEMTIASPKGGEAPLDPSSVEAFKNDPVSAEFLKNQESLWKNTVRLADIVPRTGEFDAIFYVGGHGPMFDLVSDPISLSLIQTFAAARKPVSAVCHGPIVFANATTPSGEPLVKGATVTGFSNVEEEQVQMVEAMPFLLEDKLVAASDSTKYVKAEQPWGEKVVVDKTYQLGGPLITGQNPASATGVGKALLKALGL